MDLDNLAIEAKASSTAFEDLLVQVEPLLEPIINKYNAYWNVEREELLQWMRIEVWNAVKLFRPGMMPFLYFCRMTVTNHIKKRLYRLFYGKASGLNRQAVRIDQWVEQYTEVPFLESPSVEVQVFRSLSLDAIKQCLGELKLTDLEAHCMRRFYIDEYTYAEIKEELNLSSRKPIDNALARVRKKVRENNTLRALYEELYA